MRSLKAVCWTAAVLCCAVTYGQPRDGDRARPEGPRDGERREGPRDGDRPDRPRDGDRRDGDREDFVERMMRLDKNGDGKIEKSELADERINRLFARADADKNDVVTADELKALEREEGEAYGRRGPGGPPEGRGPGGPPEGRGPGGPPRGDGGPRDGFGPPRGEGGPRDGFGPPRGMMGPPRLGELMLPPPVQNALDLSAEQREQIADLQKDINARLEKILNDKQRNMLKEMRERMPNRPGGPGGPPRGEGGPGGPPRGDRDRGDRGPDGPPPEDRGNRRPQRDE